MFATGSTTGELNLWDLNAAHERTPSEAVKPLEPARSLVGHESVIRNLSWARAPCGGGTPLLASMDDLGQLCIWDVRDPWSPVLRKGRLMQALSLAWLARPSGVSLLLSQDPGGLNTSFREVGSRGTNIAQVELNELCGRGTLKSIRLAGGSAAVVFEMGACARTGHTAMAWSSGLLEVCKGVDSNDSVTTTVAAELTQCARAGGGVACVLAANAPTSARASSHDAAAMSSQLHGWLALQSVSWSPNAGACSGWLACGGRLGVVLCVRQRRGAERITALYSRDRKRDGGSSGRRKRKRDKNEDEDEDEDGEEDEEEDSDSEESDESDESGTESSPPEDIDEDSDEKSDAEIDIMGD